MDFGALISELKTKLTGANEHLTKLAEQRRPFALDAVTGDAEAKKTIKKIDVDVAAVRSDAETLTIAIEEAEKRKVEHDAKIAAEDRRRREAEAREFCEAILRTDKDFDRLAGLLRQSLKDREHLIQNLAGLGVIYPGVINALAKIKN